MSTELESDRHSFAIAEVQIERDRLSMRVRELERALKNCADELELVWKHHGQINSNLHVDYSRAVLGRVQP